jgi:hypothetical protein
MILALTRKRTMLPFKKRHFCQTHEQMVDEAHLSTSEEVVNTINIKELREKVSMCNLRDMPSIERESLITGV